MTADKMTSVCKIMLIVFECESHLWTEAQHFFVDSLSNLDKKTTAKKHSSDIV